MAEREPRLRVRRVKNLAEFRSSIGAFDIDENVSASRFTNPCSLGFLPGETGFGKILPGSHVRAYEPDSLRRLLQSAPQHGRTLHAVVVDDAFWFLREEGQFLRPTFDYGTYRFDGVFPPWSEGPRLPPRQRLGALLLTPSANSDALDDYARYLWNVGDIACELLGKPDCIRRIRSLQSLGNAALRHSACGFLKGQLGANCQ